ncbi:hypothetical protein [Lysobacter humi (ex Lee et al. 2017)]
MAINAAPQEYSRQPPFVAIAIALAALAMLPFLLGLGGDFIFDDRQTVQYNGALRMASLDLEHLLRAAYSFEAGNGSRMLAMLTFALDYWRGGGDPAVFKTTNVLIHCVTTVALAAFLRRLFLMSGAALRPASSGALALSLLWALHPLQVSAVLYVVQRMQTLGTLFLVLALWTYLRMREAQIEGRRSRHFGIVTALFWGLALASKEDSVLLPLYAFLLEITVLRFGAAEQQLARRLRLGYSAVCALGALAFFLVIVPHYWHWDAYPGRTFSSSDRLLSQARVLAMYIGQILFPLPGHLHFYYDDFPVSRGLLDPPSTAAAVVFIAGLLSLAVQQRRRRPLVALGILLFFAGHSMTSNVVNLELAFEHRNHFPLIGALIAVGALAAELFARFRMRHWVPGAACALAIAGVSAATAIRAQQWGEPSRFAALGVELAPRSIRAWSDLCTHQFDLSVDGTDSQKLARAITTCERGAAATRSPQLLFNVIVYKTIAGRPTRGDWPVFLKQLEAAPPSAELEGIYHAILKNVDHGFPLDPAGTVQALHIVARRTPLSDVQYVHIATYVYKNGANPESALPFLEQAVRIAPPGSPLIDRVLVNLTAAGRSDWVDHLRGLRKVKPRTH